MESGVHSSLHANCHHHITFAKFNLKIHYPPPYEREVWHYQKANVDQIRQAISRFPWDNRFANINVNEQVQLFTQTIINIISNYIPHETITCDDSNPPWIDEKFEKLILSNKNRAFSAYSRDRNNTDLFNKFQSLQAHLITTTEKFNLKYYSRLSDKLLDSKTSPKSYWSILKTFLNNKKIPCIPPLLHNGKSIIDFKEKAELFNDFFSKQCSLVNNNSKLPSVLTKKTCKSLSSVEFSTYDILKIIRNLYPNKAHGHDMISIRMLKICDESICKPLGIIFRSCLENGKFPSEWKKANVFPVFKKNNKQDLKNYRPISLLPVSDKIFERLLYNSMFKLFTENNLISQSQSGFKPGDSCTNHLLSITHQIYKSFDDGHEVHSYTCQIGMRVLFSN